MIKPKQMVIKSSLLTEVCINSKLWYTQDVKTEKEFSEYFLQIYQEHAQQNDTSPQDVKNLADVYWSDLTAHLSFYFSNEDRLKMTEKAAVLLAKNKSEHEFTEAWKRVLLDFNQNNYWNFRSVQKKPKVAQTEEQKIFWKLFKYTWAFFQAMVILKIAVYYFGLESASHPDQVSSIWVWIFFGLSVSSLGFFAYFNRNDKN